MLDQERKTQHRERIGTKGIDVGETSEAYSLKELLDNNNN